jgi:hypothetical protein
MQLFGVDKTAKVLTNRPQQQLVYVDPESEEVEVDGFTAMPAEDVPKNQLTEKLARGIQNFV